LCSVHPRVGREGEEEPRYRPGNQPNPTHHTGTTSMIVYALSRRYAKLYAACLLEALTGISRPSENVTLNMFRTLLLEK